MFQNTHYLLFKSRPEVRVEIEMETGTISKWTRCEKQLAEQEEIFH